MFGKALNTLAAQGAGTLAALAIGVVLARVLGPSGRGSVSYAWLVLGLAAVFADGPAAAVVAQYARERISRADVYGALLRALPVLVVPAAAGLAIAAFTVPGQLPLIAVACALPFAVFAQCIKGFFLAEGRIRGANAIDVTSGAGYALLGSTVVLLGGGITGALATWVAAYAASALYGVMRLNRGPELEAKGASVARADLVRGQLVFGGKSGLVYAAGYVNLRVGAFVVAASLGSAALGIYTVVLSLAELLWKISNALAWSAFGRIAGDDESTVGELIARLSRTILLIELPFGAALFVFGPWLIEHVYGAAFASAGTPLRLMVLAVVAYAIEPVFGYFLLVRCKRPLLVMTIQLGSAAACTAIAAVTIPRYGIAGAAAATAATYTAVVAVKACIVARTLRVPLSDLVIPRTADVRGAVRGVRRLFVRTPAPAADVAA